MLRLHVPFDCDVVVVGAGPAGSAAAYFIAKAGLRVILLDRCTFPRDKVCGDFLGPVALVELSGLSLSRVDRLLDTNKIFRATLYLDGKPLISKSMPRLKDLPSYGRVVPRKVLDEWLVQTACKAGAELLEGFHAAHVRHGAGGAEVHGVLGGKKRILRAPIIIGSDGSNSVCAESVSDKADIRADRIVAVRAYAQGIAGPADEADLYFSSSSFPGYYWLFPIDATTANIGIGTLRTTVPPTDLKLRPLLGALVRNDSALRKRLGERKLDRIVGWPLSTYDPKRRLVRDGIMLIGDAAGLINPLNGEGIQYALASGRLAARTAVNCFAAGRFSENALRPYAESIEREFGQDLGIARLIVRTIANRSLNTVWLTALRLITARARIDPNYADLAGGVLAGVVPASELLSRRVIVGSLEQAAVSALRAGIVSSAGGPSRIAGHGIDLMRQCFGVSYDMARYPGEFLQWGTALGRDAAALGVSYARKAFTLRDEQSRAHKSRSIM